MTSAEIARLANVSRSTVSRVLNRYSNVPEATRLKVQRVIDEHGYTPNHSARILAGKTNNIIGIFLADIYENRENNRWVGVNAPYNMEMLSYFIKEGKKHGYLTLVDTISDLKECQDMESYFSNRMLYGGIFIGFPYRTKELEEMSQKGYNVVVVDQLSDEDDEDGTMKRVNTDNVMGGYVATKYLIDHGHRNILFMAGDKRLSSLEREKGYVKALEEADLPVYSPLHGLYHEEVAYEVCKSYLKAFAENPDKVPEEERPTAIFVANDIMALGVIRALEEFQWKVPEEMSVIGFDNLQWSIWMDLQLTSVDISKKDLANSAIHRLLGHSLAELPLPQVVERGSVATRLPS